MEQPGAWWHWHCQLSASPLYPLGHRGCHDHRAGLCGSSEPPPSGDGGSPALLQLPRAGRHGSLPRQAPLAFAGSQRQAKVPQGHLLKPRCCCQPQWKGPAWAGMQAGALGSWGILGLSSNLCLPWDAKLLRGNFGWEQLDPEVGSTSTCALSAQAASGRSLPSLAPFSHSDMGAIALASLRGGVARVRRGFQRAVVMLSIIKCRK